MELLINKIRNCNLCNDYLLNGARPVIQISEVSKIIIIGQAPGRKVHESGIPWNDASGKTLRRWLNVDEGTFYNPDYFSIMPMGFCYPGKGKSGDLPPRAECAPLWHAEILNHFKCNPLILLIGQYAQRYYLGKSYKEGLTETVRCYKDFYPKYFPLPHPSPRNQHWVKTNKWFINEVIPDLQRQVSSLLKVELLK
jgi:uracil-DNA glycosylase